MNFFLLIFPPSKKRSTSEAISTLWLFYYTFNHRHHIISASRLSPSPSPSLFLVIYWHTPWLCKLMKIVVDFQLLLNCFTFISIGKTIGHFFLFLLKFLSSLNYPNHDIIIMKYWVKDSFHGGNIFPFPIQLTCFFHRNHIYTHLIHNNSIKSFSFIIFTLSLIVIQLLDHTSWLYNPWNEQFYSSLSSTGELKIFSQCNLGKKNISSHQLVLSSFSASLSSLVHDKIV